MIRVLIVAEIRLYREGLAQLLGRRSGMTVVGVKSDLREAVAEIQGLGPNVVVLDMAMPESCATVRELKRLAPGLAVVALGVGEVQGAILEAVEAGVAGYVTREGSLDDLAAVVESAVRGELHCSLEIAGSLARRLAALASDREASPSRERLTTRECEIIRLLQRDLSNKEIAVCLGIEVATVKNHVHNLLEKLNVRRRTEAARLFRHLDAWTKGTTSPPQGTLCFLLMTSILNRMSSG